MFLFGSCGKNSWVELHVSSKDHPVGRKKGHWQHWAGKEIKAQSDARIYIDAWTRMAVF